VRWGRAETVEDSVGDVCNGFPRGSFAFQTPKVVLEDVLLEHPAMQGISFTGSTSVGKELVRRSETL
jgi:acyl-CoA reductase-like NAD-dependent aldehyde dehydrogenase